MRKIFFCSLLYTSAFPTSAQTATAGGAAYIQLTAYSLAQTDAFSFNANQAALAAAKNFSAGIYGERTFMLSELGLYRLSAVLPTPTGNFGCQVLHAGSSLYSESKLGLAYARGLGKVDIGIQFNYHSIRAGGYGSAASINAEGGLLFHVTEKFTTGVHLYNPTGSKLGKHSEERLPVIYSAGLGYDASEKLFIGAEIQKAEGQPVNANAGLHYCFADQLVARLGTSTATSSFYFGGSFRWQHLRIDATASVHPHLGITPGILLIYNPQKK